MSKRNSDQQPLPPANVLGSRLEIEQLLRRQIERGRQLSARTIRSQQDLDQAHAERDRWSNYNRELLLRYFDNRSVADEYERFHGGVFPLNPSLQQQIQMYDESVTDKINRLMSVVERLELIPVVSPAASESASTVTSSGQGLENAVFIVHGHDEAAKEAVARFIMRFGLRPIILAEEPNSGRTIIEKLEASSKVGFAVVLLTADDIGAAKSDVDNLKPRARQNVILELGYFVGKLGRERVCALYRTGIEIPSDYHGVAYVPLDEQGAWRLALAREMKTAGLNVDLNLVL